MTITSKTTTAILQLGGLCYLGFILLIGFNIVLIEIGGLSTLAIILPVTILTFAGTTPFLFFGLFNEIHVNSSSVEVRNILNFQVAKANLKDVTYRKYTEEYLNIKMEGLIIRIGNLNLRIPSKRYRNYYELEQFFYNELQENKALNSESNHFNLYLAVNLVVIIFLFLYANLKSW
jgi:hypothetical protein